MKQPATAANLLIRWGFACALAVVSVVGAWSVGFSRAAAAETYGLKLRFIPRNGNGALLFDSLSLTNLAGQNCSVTRLDFLMSDVALRRADGVWLEETN